MVPKIKLPENFRVRTFGSSKNSHRLEKYLLVVAATKPMSTFHFNVGVGVERISETWLSDSLP